MAIKRIVILGAGAVGAGTAAELSLRGIDHLLIGRGAQIRHIAEHGLSYHRPQGVQIVPINVAEGVGEAQLRPGDLIILATKTQHVEQASADLAWQPVEGGGVAAELPILCLQNGLEAERVLVRRFSTVYSGSVLIPASYTETGTVISGAAPKIANFVLGKYPSGLDETARELAEILQGIHWLVQLDDNVIRWKAQKLLHNVKNGIELLDADQDQKKQLGKALTAEAHAVLDAAGIPVASNDERTVDLSQFNVESSSGYRSGQQSTWQSLARGADSEVDYLNGEIVLLGRLHGVPTPVNTALQRTLGHAWLNRLSPGEVPTADVLGAIA